MTPAAPHALLVGEALVDVVHSAPGVVAEHPGGSVANVALTLGRLGRDARLATWIGADQRGDAITTWLTESGVTLVDGSMGAPHTSTAIATLDATGAASYEFDLTWQVPVDAQARVDTLVVHSGSIATTLDPGGQEVVTLFNHARSTATITYDPNIRPSIMTDRAATQRRAEELVRLADVVKASDEDLAFLGDGDPVDLAAQWAQWGPALVVVTRGGAGVVAVTRDFILEVPAPLVTVVDTVGAGDSLMGGLIDGLWEASLLGADRRDHLHRIDRDTVRNLLERCTRIAAVTVSRAGAQPPWRGELTV